MEKRDSYPQWYRTFRAFMAGVTFGILFLWTLLALEVIPMPGALRFSSLIMLIVNACPVFITTGFEIGFRIQRYRRQLREMDGRVAL